MLSKAILLLLSPLLLYQNSAPSTGSEPQPYEDAEAYEVYSAILLTGLDWNVANRKALVICSETTIYKMCLRPEPESEKLIGQAISEFVRLNKKTWLLQRSFNIEKPYTLIPINELRTVIKQGGWEKLYQQHPDSVGWVDLSAVGFNSDKTVAVVYMGYHCGMLCGGGRYHALQKKDGKWIPLKWRVGCAWQS